MKKIAGPALLFLTGCGWIEIRGNLPGLSYHVLEVVNKSDYELEITASGERVRFESENETSERLLPTQTGVIRFRSFSQYGSDASVAIKAWKKGRLVEAISGKVYVHAYGSHSSVWIVRNEDFNRQNIWRLPW